MNRNECEIRRRVQHSSQFLNTSGMRPREAHEAVEWVRSDT